MSVPRPARGEGKDKTLTLRERWAAQSERADFEAAKVALGVPFWCESWEQAERYGVRRRRRRAVIHGRAARSGWMYRMDALDYGPPPGFVLGGTDQEALMNGRWIDRLSPSPPSPEPGGEGEGGG